LNSLTSAEQEAALADEMNANANEGANPSTDAKQGSGHKMHAGVETHMSPTQPAYRLSQPVLAGNMEEHDGEEQVRGSCRSSVGRLLSGK
jgi:hypothetical protein